MNYKIDDNAKILVIGDLMIDHYIYGNCNRISPEAPVPVVEIKSESYTLGGAGNVLKNLISFGCTSNIISIVGNDDNAGIVANELAGQNINSDGIIKDQTRCTTIKSRILAVNHQLIRMDRESVEPISPEIEQLILASLTQNIKGYGVLLISDYNKGLLTKTLLKGIVEICSAAGVKTIVDPKGLDFSKYWGVNVIKPNKKEASMATGITINSMESLEAACKKIKEVANCDDVIITMSEEGMAYYSNNTLSVIPTKALDVVDVTGAGDTVLASLGLALASGNSLHIACDFANHAAAVVVNKVGSATATLHEVEQKFLN